MEGHIHFNSSDLKGSLANAVLLLINQLFINLKIIGDHSIYPRDYSTNLYNEENPTFDFIIVGGGASGCVLAHQLVNTSMDWKVLLLEAGDYPPPASVVPALYDTFAFTQYDWAYRINKQSKRCTGMVNEECYLTRAKVLGGTSTINNMHYIRAFPDDYDRFQIPFWNSNVTANVYSALENISDSEDPAIGFQYNYGRSGLCKLHLLNSTHALKNILYEAYNEEGYLRIPKRKYIGYLDYFKFLVDNERQNIAKYFLKPIKEDLYLSLNSEVDSVYVAEVVEKRVKGVNVTIRGESIFVKAKKEVILTAGAVNNAKILLMSGIGPRDYLLKHGIPVVNNLGKVGKNLQIHLSLPLFFSVNLSSDNKTKNPESFFTIEDHVSNVFTYIIQRKGDWTNTNVNEFVKYINTKKMGITIPNLAVHHNYYKINDMGLEGFLRNINYKPTVVRALLKYNTYTEIVMLTLRLLYPVSRGEVVLNQTHHKSNPEITANFMHDEGGHDFETMLSGFSYLTHLMDNKILKQHDFNFLDIDVANCRNYKFCSKRYVECYMRNMAYPTTDMAGTLQMGEKCDGDAVVSTELEVNGVRGLRVADASALRRIVAVNTVANDMMMGMRLGEILKEKWIKDYESPFHMVVEEEEEEEQS